MSASPAVVVIASGARAEALAQQLGLSLVAAAADAAAEALLLDYVDDELELRPAGEGPGTGISVDFRSLDLRPGTPGLSRRQPLAKAVGPAPATVVDATAGLGQDTMLLAALGHEVTAVERSPVIAALLADGLRRAAADPALAGACARITPITGDARRVLSQMVPPPDVVYIDPMYPPKRKASALAPKRIRVVRQVVGDDPDAAELLAAARRCARRRVVVKRPILAPPLAPRPAGQHRGKLARYDVYA